MHRNRKASTALVPFGVVIAERQPEPASLRGMMPLNRWAVLAGALFAAWTCIPTNAQIAKQTFEVASVKKQAHSPTLRDLGGRGPLILPGGVFQFKYATVTALIQFAYQITSKQLVGGPDWIRTDYFAVDARATADARPEQIRLMLRTLLEDRFALKVRSDQRELRHLVLARARSDGRLGPYVVSVPGDTCDAGAWKEATEQMPPREIPPEGFRANLCGPSSSIRQLVETSMGELVVDKTELPGTWALQFHSDNPNSPNARETGSGRFEEALREQLGLKLEATRGPVEFLVIESAKQPTPD